MGISMKQLPENVKAYNKTQTYTYRTTPGMMKNDHSTRPGVWGKIVVERGEVTYFIVPDEETHILTPENPGVIEPAVLHRIDPQQQAKFYVEFYRS